jgi:glycosyltransferase involved in cell wall biosynthesis
MCEGTPNQILEASSSGKCWISTNVGIVEELQKDFQCGIVINRTEIDLSNALDFLYDKRNIIVEYGNNGRKAIEKTWSWENNSKQFCDFFDFNDKIRR